MKQISVYNHMGQLEYTEEVFFHLPRSKLCAFIVLNNIFSVYNN